MDNDPDTDPRPPGNRNNPDHIVFNHEASRQQISICTDSSNGRFWCIRANGETNLSLANNSANFTGDNSFVSQNDGAYATSWGDSLKSAYCRLATSSGVEECIPPDGSNGASNWPGSGGGNSNDNGNGNSGPQEPQAPQRIDSHEFDFLTPEQNGHGFVLAFNGAGFDMSEFRTIRLYNGSSLEVEVDMNNVRAGAPGNRIFGFTISPTRMTMSIGSNIVWTRAEVLDGNGAVLDGYEKPAASATVNIDDARVAERGIVLSGKGFLQVVGVRVFWTRPDTSTGSFEDLRSDGRLSGPDDISTVVGTDYEPTGSVSGATATITKIEVIG